LVDVLKFSCLFEKTYSVNPKPIFIRGLLIPSVP